jgi:hypothetical protein
MNTDRRIVNPSDTFRCYFIKSDECPEIERVHAYAVELCAVAHGPDILTAEANLKSLITSAFKVIGKDDLWLNIDRDLEEKHKIALESGELSRDWIAASTFKLEGELFGM